MTMLAALVSSVVLGAYLVAAQQPPPAPQQTMINKTTAISEKGEPIKGAGDTPNQHDILTGSQPDGRAYTDGADHTCGNWTSGAAGTAQLGHHDRTGGGNTSWNSTHPSRGCSQENLVATGGAGLLYCFAIN